MESNTINVFMGKAGWLRSALAETLQGTVEDPTGYILHEILINPVRVSCHGEKSSVSLRR